MALFVGTVLKTLAGNEITVSGGMVGGSKIKKSDIKVDNAVLHAVVDVILVV